jgi:hypothetical protein
MNLLNLSIFVCNLIPQYFIHTTYTKLTNNILIAHIFPLPSEGEGQGEGEEMKAIPVLKNSIESK